jgi:predicted aldo/keto reductase-like oxidoreductase
MHTTIQEEQVVAGLQQQEVHPNKNIQHGLDLWERVREYDNRSAAEDFTPVLTRKQKQKLKLQQVFPK